MISLAGVRMRKTHVYVSNIVYRLDVTKLDLHTGYR